MAYKPATTLVTKVGEARTWTVDTEAVDALNGIGQLLVCILQQLELITDVNIEPGENEDLVE